MSWSLGRVRNLPKISQRVDRVPTRSFCIQSLASYPILTQKSEGVYEFHGGSCAGPYLMISTFLFFLKWKMRLSVESWVGLKRGWTFVESWRDLEELWFSWKVKWWWELSRVPGISEECQYCRAWASGGVSQPYDVVLQDKFLEKGVK